MSEFSGHFHILDPTVLHPSRRFLEPNLEASLKHDSINTQSNSAVGLRNPCPGFRLTGPASSAFAGIRTDLQESLFRLCACVFRLAGDCDVGVGFGPSLVVEQACHGRCIASS